MCSNILNSFYSEFHESYRLMSMCSILGYNNVENMKSVLSSSGKHAPNSSVPHVHENLKKYPTKDLERGEIYLPNTSLGAGSYC